MDITSITRRYSRRGLAKPNAAYYLWRFVGNGRRSWQAFTTRPSFDDVPAELSQVWHRDPEDLKLVKAFVDLSDVTADSGPFTYIPKTHSGLWLRGRPAWAASPLQRSASAWLLDTRRRHGRKRH